MKFALLFASVSLLATPALAQDSDAPPVEVDIVGGGVQELTAIAVPAMPVGGGAPSTLGRQIAEVIASDLRSTGLFTPLGPNGIGSYTLGQANAPAYGEWRNAGAAQLVTGTIEPRGDGAITVGCYVHDVAAGRELARQGFAVTAANWRRAAHKCADTI